jgi:hypothetical protein
MNRPRLLLGILLLLGFSNAAFYLWRTWGLITLHARDRPLSEVLRSIERQGHVVIRSQLDPVTLVRMDVDKVTLEEALETLAAVTDARWRLTYLVGDPAAVSGALGSLAAGQRLEGWKLLHYPLPPMSLEEAPVLNDPRADVWQVQPPKEQKLHAYLDAGARSVSAAFAVPESWNPDVLKPPHSGPVGRVTAQLARAAHGRCEEFIALQPDRRERGAEGRGERGEGEDRARGRDFNPAAMEQRALAEIEKLPPEKRASAKAEFEERKAFFSQLRDLPREERMVKMQELFERPEIQERYEKERSERDARQTPAQRMARAQRYRERKQQVISGSKP